MRKLKQIVLGIRNDASDRVRYTDGNAAMNEATRQFLIRWLMVDAGAALLLVWGLVNIYLDKRDRKRQQPK